MRTFWIILASHLLLGSGCTSGEYTTNPDLALPAPDLAKPNSQDMAQSNDMASAIDMTTLWGVSIPGFTKCSCMPDNTGKCNLIQLPTIAEQCNGLDDNCDGRIDEGSPQVTDASYRAIPLPNTNSWDANCNGQVEYGVQFTDESTTQRNLIVIPGSGTCNSNELTTICRKYTTMNDCNLAAVACLDLSSKLCGQVTLTMYKCNYNSMLSPACSSSTATLAFSDQKILCR